MKRKIFLIIIIVCLAAAGFGGTPRRGRSIIQKIIELTSPKTKGKLSFEETLSKLRSTSRFTGQTLERAIISQLAWAGVGNRQTPSAAQFVPDPLQSAFPMQLFFATGEGVFFYQPLSNSLVQLVEGDARAAIAGTTPASESVISAGCVIIITTTDNRATGARPSGSRIAAPGRGGTANNNKNASLLEAGHIAQNIQLQAASLEQDLGSIAISNFEAPALEKACGLPRDYDALYMICVGYLAAKDKEGSDGSPAIVPKRAAIIVPSENFDDAEFFVTKNTLEAAKIEVVVASNRIGPIKGINGGLFEVRNTADKIRVDDFDAIVITGGPGVKIFINMPVVLGIVNAAFNQRKIIGATSRGTLVLANAGILKGIKATGLLDDSIAIINSGAVFTNVPVEKDMPIITGRGGNPEMSRTFADALAYAILGK